MRRILISILFLILFSASQTTIAASNTSHGKEGLSVEEKVRAREERIIQIHENIQNRIQERIATKEAKMTQLKQNLIKKYYQNMSAKLWATIERLDILTLRIEARISVVEMELGKNLTSVNSNVSQAKDLLANTKVLLTSSDNMINDVLNSEDPKAAFSVLKENIADIKANLKEVHLLLVKIIGEIEGLHVGTDNNAPTTIPKAT